jgi:hypothetical protein
MIAVEHKHDGNKALVAVFEDLASAGGAILELRKLGFDHNSLELVTHESPNVTELTGADITGSFLIDSATSGGAAGIGMGAAAGVIATLLSGFPGLGLAMIFGGGLTGAIIGGVAGIERAVQDDTVNLPTIDEYESLISQGKKLMVVRGSHKQVIKARDAISKIQHLRAHLYTLHGHQFHEHPSG